MKSQTGFTIVEVIFCLAVIAGIGFVGLGLLSGGLSLGVNGLTETRCVGGYKFLIGEGGQARQVLNENGGGIPCP